MKYFINTYGCQMNVHESEKIAGILNARGMTKAERIEDADFLVYNTCCVRETAENKIYGHLGMAKKLKETRRGIRIILCGCMAQKPDELRVLRQRLPHVDLIIGTHNLHLLGEYLDRLNSGRVFEVWNEPRDHVYSIKSAPHFASIDRDSKLSAFVNIMQGCNNFCSYCIVPYVRGRERSRSAAEIVAEVEGLVAAGYKEITLLGQNVNSYNADSYMDGAGDDGGIAVGGDKRVDFCALLERLNAINITKDGERARFRIKFMTSHPKDLSMDVIATIARGENLAKYIHLPVQSGSNRVLKLMNRPYTRENYLELVGKIRSMVPDAGLSSDLMVGFPTEDDKDFEDSLDLVERVRFNNLFTFVYNRRSGTKADQMEGQIDEQIKTERIERIIARQAEIGSEDAAACVGKIFEVLCESVSDGFGFGKSWEDRPVRFAAKNTDYGQFLKVKIIGYQNTKLIGEIVR